MKSGPQITVLLFLCILGVISLTTCAAIHELPLLPSGERVEVPGDGVKLGGYLFRPSDPKKQTPAIILLHGWGLNAGTLVPSAEILIKEGYVALALSMRGWPGSGGIDDCALKQPDDTIKALEWLASQPGVDGDRMGLLGFSQGGQVALLTGARTTRLKAIVAYYPVTDVDRWKSTTAHPTIPYYITSVCEPGGSKWRSPLFFADKINAPVLLIHGDGDTRVPTEQSILMKGALEKAGKKVELRLVRGASHIFTQEQRSEARP